MAAIYIIGDSTVEEYEKRGTDDVGRPFFSLRHDLGCYWSLRLEVA